jgi:hypothetical protein
VYDAGLAGLILLATLTYTGYMAEYGVLFTAKASYTVYDGSILSRARWLMPLKQDWATTWQGWSTVQQARINATLSSIGAGELLTLHVLSFVAPAWQQATRHRFSPALGGSASRNGSASGNSCAVACLVNIASCFLE